MAMPAKLRSGKTCRPYSEQSEPIALYQRVLHEQHQFAVCWASAGSQGAAARRAHTPNPPSDSHETMVVRSSRRWSKEDQ
ncbi:hypothetical protein FOYG_10834 [Fusarium oxysporum NRRL 32931]|uniref:Uncharacterized protein n=1 Tax=Fusarium oxysporum NRRL 32931 TaxID=660029 RepID=W9HZM1_FUSOX|nr:hypothetical protein FOYG_10834 [Fusarium oxysporum NRRL 32931]